MDGLMQETPLTLVHAFTRNERLFGARRLVTATARGGEERTTYGAWAERTRRLGGVLDLLELSPDARVGTFAWNTARHLELYFAAPCTGRVLHTLNVRLFAEQLVYVANHAEDEVVFCDRSLLPILWPLIDRMTTVHNVVVMDDGGGRSDAPPIPIDPRISDYEELLAQAPAVDFHIGDESRAAAMCYTSGTTGRPKGVVYSHRSSLLHAFAITTADNGAVSERDTVLPVVPMFHANAWGLPHAGVLCGAALVMPGPDLRPAAIAGLIANERVTVAGGVPTIWMALLRLLDSGSGDLSSIRAILCGGSAAPRAMLEGYRRHGVRVTHAWGMTETSPLASLSRVKASLGAVSAERELDLDLSQGLPSPLVDARIVEPGTIDELPWDGAKPGELQVRGPWIARDYYRLEGSDEAPTTSDGWLHTGDVATIDPEGYIRLVDRTKDLIKSGGEWIGSVELENAIMSHPSVIEAAVIGARHPTWGERPLACVVLEPGATLGLDDLRDFLAGTVARWWLPDAVVVLDAVPRTSVGKFDKVALRARFRDYGLPAG